MTKSLSELNARIISIGGRPNRMDCLVFDCPVCEGQHDHGIMVSWHKPSQFENGSVWTRTVLAHSEGMEIFSLSPSINCDVPWKDEAGVEHASDCKFHGWVTNGMVSW